MSSRTIAIVVAVGALLLFAAAVVGNPSVYGQRDKPSVGFAHSVYTIFENDGAILIPIVIDERPAAREAVVVKFMTEPGTAEEGEDGDYFNSTAVLTFTRRSETVQLVYVSILNDDRIGEDDETVNLSLRLLTPDTGTLGRDRATLVIVDDDRPRRRDAYIQPVFRSEDAVTATPIIPITSTPPPPPTAPPLPDHTPQPTSAVTGTAVPTGIATPTFPPVPTEPPPPIP